MTSPCAVSKYRLAGGWCAYHASVPGRAAAKRALKRAIIAVAGLPLRCELCDEVLTTAAPIVVRGQLLLVGLERSSWRSTSPP